jgi:uncharacterized membrane protein YdbT with pleckstrin-like domain
MDITSGDIESFSEGTVAEVLKVAKESMRADLNTQLEEERQKRISAENQLVLANDERLQAKERMRSKIDKVAKVASNVICFIILALLVYGTIRTFPWALPEIRSSIGRYLSSIAIFILFIFTVTSMIWGTSVFFLRSIIQKAIANTLLALITRITTI